MGRVVLQSLFVESVGLLELVALVVPDRKVVAVLECGLLSVGLLSVVCGRVDVASIGLDDGYVVECFDMVRSMFEAVFVGLQSKISFSQHTVNIANVVP